MCSQLQLGLWKHWRLSHLWVQLPGQVSRAELVQVKKLEEKIILIGLERKKWHLISSNCFKPRRWFPVDEYPNMTEANGFTTSSKYKHLITMSTFTPEYVNKHMKVDSWTLGIQVLPPILHARRKMLWKPRGLPHKRRLCYRCKLSKYTPAAKQILKVFLCVFQ